MDVVATGRELLAPTQDLVSFAFDRQKAYDDAKPLYINAHDPRQFLSYAETRTRVRRMIAGFKAIGLEDGDTVLVHLFNNYLYPSLCLSIVGAGGVFCATNPGLKSELKTILDLSCPRFVVTTTELLVTLREWAPDLDPARVIIFDAEWSHMLPCSIANPGNTSRRSMDSLLCYGESDWRRLDCECSIQSTPAAYFLTSGTTGCPKLAVLSHYSMVAHFSQIHQEVPYDVVRLGCLPLFHMFGSAWALALTIRHGQPMYVMSRFIMETYLEYIERYSITESSLAPPIVSRLSVLGSSIKGRLSSLRFVGVGGAPFTAATMRTFRSLLHGEATLSGVYGATEIGTVTMLRYGDEDDTGCVGKPLPGVKIGLRAGMSEGLSNVSHPESGREVVISSPAHMMKYHHESKDSGVDVEWYRTGDLGCVVNGKLFIVGKVKDIMKVNGFQVSPTEIEAVLLQHPDISDCGVTKTIHKGDEMPRAYVVRRNKSLSAEAVVNFSRWQLISYKALTGGVVFVREIPRLPSGKIQRHRLESMPLDMVAASDIVVTSGCWRPWAWLVRVFHLLVNQRLATTDWVAQTFDDKPPVRKLVREKT